MNQIIVAKDEKHSISFLNLITMILFILTFAIKALTDQLYIRGEISSTVVYSKYVTAAICCVTALLEMHDKGEHIFVREFDELSCICVLFTAESIVLLAMHGSIDGAVLNDLMRLIMPVILAYVVLNSLTSWQINVCMIWVLVVCVVGYFLNLVRSGVTFASLAEMNFSTSESPTEDSGFAMISLVLALYFLYFRENILLSIFSVIFCILTFKRLAIVICLLAVIISCFFPKLMNVAIDPHFRTLFKILTIALTGLWYWLLLPQQESLFVHLFGKEPTIFTSGRSSVMRYLLSEHFRSYGFGSATAFAYQTLHVPFEMDFIKIAFELTPLALFIFIWLFWDIAGTSFWGYFIVGYLVLNMITSDSLSSNFSFALAYITVGLVNESQIIGRPTIKTGEHGFFVNDYLEGHVRKSQY